MLEDVGIRGDDVVPVGEARDLREDVDALVEDLCVLSRVDDVDEDG
uniref:NET domain-containing protein n=1 Tax=Steinernema glaseri TaxID=37863 RepID=A0A1I7YSA3_9BILA